MEEQPLDYTRVRTAWKIRPERPPIPDNVTKEVSKELKDFLKHQKSLATKPTKPQQEMEPSTRQDKIKEMLSKQTLTIGLAPISSSHLEAIERKMIERGAMSESQPREERKKRTIKSVIKSWANQNLKMEDQEWDSIQMEEISQTQTEGSNIIFIKCKDWKGCSENYTES